MAIAWIVLAISAIILIGFFAFLIIVDWQTFLFSIVATALIFGAIYGFFWALSVLE